MESFEHEDGFYARDADGRERQVAAGQRPSARRIPDEDQAMSVVAHLSGLGGNILLGGGFIFPLIILMTCDSRIVRLIAKQALLLNLGVLLTGLSLILIAFTLIGIPIAIIGGLCLWAGSVTLPIIGAVQASQGLYFRYPIVGEYP